MRNPSPSRFALFFGNRGLFPASLIANARQEMTEVLKKLGHEVLMMPEDATRYGAVETPEEGRKYARFLHENRGHYDGIILSLPNFGDESGASVAMREASAPILLQAYPDEFDKMAPELRRDSFCGKFSIMDVFCQCGIKFTSLKPHTVSPRSQAFAENVAYFDRVCRVVRGMRDLTVGAIGARTTPFKTVRFDEITLQRHGITVETLDLTNLFDRMDKVDLASEAARAKAAQLRQYARWDGVAEKNASNLVRLAVALDQIIAELQLGALAVRCWTELQGHYGISPCVVTSLLMDTMIPAACEVDVANAVAMHALGCASGEPTAILDWNNNYGDEEDKCVLFHCGNTPASYMRRPGCVTDHAIIANAMGKGCSIGCNQGRIASFNFTYGGMTTLDARVKFYLGHGRFTDDSLPDNFFGCAGVAEIEGLQDKLLQIGYAGHRHHVSLTRGQVAAPTAEALTRYLGCDVMVL
jgi:L-fucose isomerase-like protein